MPLSESNSMYEVHTILKTLKNQAKALIGPKNNVMLSNFKNTLSALRKSLDKLSLA